MRSNNKARISGLADSTHASRSNFTRSPFHLAVGDLGSRLGPISQKRGILIGEIRRAMSRSTDPRSQRNSFRLIAKKDTLDQELSKVSAAEFIDASVFTK